MGKTTLLKSLMGLVPIKNGSIAFNGQDISRATPYERARAGIGFVPQGREIFSRLTVQENLAMGLAHKPVSTPVPPEVIARAAQATKWRPRACGSWCPFKPNAPGIETQITSGLTPPRCEGPHRAVATPVTAALPTGV